MNSLNQKANAVKQSTFVSRAERAFPVVRAKFARKIGSLDYALLSGAMANALPLDEIRNALQTRAGLGRRRGGAIASVSVR